MNRVRYAVPWLLISIIATTSVAAYATEYGYGLSQPTATVRTPTVQLQFGTLGSSTISNGYYATVTVTSSGLPLYYVPVTLTNSQSSATAIPLQVLVQSNPSLYSAYEAPDLGNIRFCLDAACTNKLYSWLEGCGSIAPYGTCSTASTSATFWVKLTSSIAGGGGTLTIYMVFLSASTEFDGVQAGEAPTLPGTYAQYDNGANVFAFYDDFAGTSISSAWNTVGAQGTYSVDNGLTMYSAPFPSAVLSLNSQYTGPLIVDAYQVGTYGDWLGASFSNIQSTSSSFGITSGAVQWVYPPEGADGYDGLCISSGCTLFTPNPPSTTLQVVTLAVNSTAATEYQDYANPAIASGTTSLASVTPAVASGTTSLASVTPAVNSTAPTKHQDYANPAVDPGTISLTNYPGIVQVAYSDSDTQTTYWFRLRAYPPSDVMPSASFGSLSAETILTVTNSGSSSWLANLVTVTSSNTARLNNLTISFRNPYSKQVVLGTGVPNQDNGPQVTLGASSTLLITMGVTVSSSGTSTVTLALKIQVPPGSSSTSVYCYDIISLTVN